MKFGVWSPEELGLGGVKPACSRRRHGYKVQYAPGGPAM